MKNRLRVTVWNLKSLDNASSLVFWWIASLVTEVVNRVAALLGTLSAAL